MPQVVSHTFGPHTLSIMPERAEHTLKLAADTFNVVIQFGAIAAVALLYWPQLLSMLYGALGRDPAPPPGHW